jgi:hypothetical protein
MFLPTTFWFPERRVDRRAEGLFLALDGVMEGLE